MLFVVAIVAPMLVLFLRGLVGDPQPLDSSEVAREVLSDFLTTVGAIVAAKTLRFRNAIPSIRPNSDRFLHITDPKSQIHIISNAAVGFICKNYGLTEDQVDITIIRRKPAGAWHFHYLHHASWKHTEPPRLMTDSSAAASCLASG
jgi:hypothetical protein